MKKILLGLLIGLGITALTATAASIFNVQQGGTGVGSVSNGAMLYGSSTNQSLNVLPIGSNGKVLTSNGTIPSWQPLPGGSGATTTINSATGPAFSFATTSDTNLLLSIITGGSTATFTPAWTGQLSVARGGTGTSTLGNLTVGTNLNISGGQQVLIGTSTLISLGTNVVTSVSTTSAGSVFNAVISSNNLALTFPANLLTTTTAASTYVTQVTGSGNIQSSGGLTPNITFTGVLPLANGGIATTTLGNLTVSSANLSITGGQQVLIGTSTQITLTANPSFTNGTFTGTLGVTGTSTLATTTITKLTVTGIPTLSGVSDCNGTSFLQITSGLFGCGTPTGGGGGSGGGWATATPATIYNSFGNIVGINSSTPTANLVVEGVAASSTLDILRIASSSHATLFSIQPNGNIFSSIPWGSGPALPTITTVDDSILLWYPKKAAFRAGEWDISITNSDIGDDGSVAFGYDTIASGVDSFAAGDRNHATGFHSFAMGSQSNATTSASIAFGFQNNVGGSAYGVAIGGRNNTVYNEAAAVIGGEFNTALGEQSLVWGNAARTGPDAFLGLAFGDHANTDGDSSFSIGEHASANCIFFCYAIGNQSTASGTGGLSLGQFTASNGTGAMVFGRGIDENNRLTNLVSNTLGIGMNSTVPTLTFTDSGGVGNVGMVGIGTTTPLAELHVQPLTAILPFLISSSTGTSMFTIQPTGTTTIANLNAANCDVKSNGGDLYCGTDATGGGGSGATTTINSASGPAFTFATTSDTNILLSIITGGSTATFTPAWTGVLAPARGGTGTSTVPTQQGQILIADGTGIKYAPGTLLNTATLSWSTSTVQQLSANVLKVPNALTFNNGGAGAASGQTFDGSAAATISYNTIGAQPLLSNPVTGTGTNGKNARWTSASTIGDGAFIDDGTVTGIGATSTGVALTVKGIAGNNNPLTVSSSTGLTLFQITPTGIASTTNLTVSALGTCSNGLITSAGGVVACNGSAFLTGNQTITLTGAVTGSGATSIATVFQPGAFATGTSGTNFNIATTTTTLIINCPDASASNRGCLTTTDWSTFNNKQATISVTAPITLTGASVGIVNQGTTAQVLHGNASGNASFGQIVNADITNSTIDLAAKVTGILPVANGGTGAANLTASDILFGNGTSAVATSSLLTFAASSGLSAPTTTIASTVTVSSGTTASLLTLNGTYTLATSSTLNLILTNPTINTIASMTPATAVYMQNTLPAVTLSAATTTITSFYNEYRGMTMTTGTITSFYGSYIDAPTVNGSSTITNAYGLIVAPTSSTTKYTVLNGIGSTTPTATLVIQGSGGQSQDILRIASSTSTNILQVTSAAQVLIGTAARLTIPQGTAPTLTAAGDIMVDTTQDQLLYGGLSGSTNVVMATSSKTMTIIAPTASEDDDFFVVDAPITITKVTCVSRNSNTSSVTFSLPHNTDRSSGTANVFSSGQVCNATTTPSSFTTFSDATLAAGEVLWATTSATTLASTTSITIFFKYDRQ